MRRLLILFILFASAPLIAQDAPKPAAQPAPYTDVETLRIQNVNLERVIVQRALEDWQAKVKRLKADLEKARPGFVWNPETGEWTAAPETKKQP